ncbi:response regulator [Vibrio mimicus]|uniref:response regulator n=1 Tax=Vibrio vulnificus TaxID=672 RepID=UPI00117E37D1|nr:response regulator [Vibrio vulnificus]
MKLNNVNICIVDDEDIYFNADMINIANDAGFEKIDRYSKIDNTLLSRLQKKPYDIVILDIQGITEPDIAKDGMQVASLLSRTTCSYIVVTSAHQFHLVNDMTKVDYVMENKIQTTADFVDELIEIVDDFLNKKSSFYKKVLFKIGFSMLKKNVA